MQLHYMAFEQVPQSLNLRGLCPMMFTPYQLCEGTDAKIII